VRPGRRDEITIRRANIKGHLEVPFVEEAEREWQWGIADGHASRSGRVVSDPPSRLNSADSRS
jgi:hypothetical protein